MHGAGLEGRRVDCWWVPLSQAPGGFYKHWVIHTSQQRPEEWDSTPSFQLRKPRLRSAELAHSPALSEGWGGPGPAGLRRPLCRV